MRIVRGGDMRYVKLEDYIATLSEAEKEQYKNLIQESRERDINLRKNFDESKKNLEKLLREIEACAEAATTFKKALVDLNTIIREVHTKIYLHANTASRSAQHDGILFQEYPKSLN